MLFDFFLFCKLSHVSTIVQYSFEFHRRPSLSQPNFNSSALIANYKCQMRTNKTQTDDVKPGTLRVRQHRERALIKKEEMKRTAYLESRVKELEEENMLLKQSATTEPSHHEHDMEYGEEVARLRMTISGLRFQLKMAGTRACYRMLKVFINTPNRPTDT